MLLITLVRTSHEVAATRSRNAKRDALAHCLKRFAGHEIAPGVAYLSGRLPQGRIGIGPAILRQVAGTAAAVTPALTIADVDDAIERLVAVTGKGAGAERRRVLAALLARATRDEQHFLMRLLHGELRQGALDGVMVEAIAAAAAVPPAAVRRAFMLSGDSSAVARTAFDGGAGALAGYRLALGTPVQSMLAQSADDVESAVGTLGRAVLDYKMDGARVQVHKLGSDVRVFSRRLNDVSASVPEVVEAVEAVGALGAETLVLDGEAIVLDAAGRPLPFQETMRRFGRKRSIEQMRASLPLSVYFFDCLHAGGHDLIEAPLAQRLDALDAALPNDLVMPRVLTADPAAAATFLAAALGAGHEGVMAKDPGSPYEAGNRGSSWLKVKSAYTLDLVILAAEWGHGRRQGWLSNLHLGARDEVSGELVMLGKTFKGLTDEMLTWQTAALLDREVARDAYTVYVRPEIVVEVTFNGVQASPQYPAGLALRFARVERYRPDKGAAEADTIETVRALHRLAVGDGK